MTKGSTLRRRVLPLILALPATGCASLESLHSWELAQDVDVTYRPVVICPPVPDAARVSVTVTARDTRTERRDRISTIRNAFEQALAPVRPRSDVVVLTARALEAELAACGFTIGGGDVRVDIEVMRFYLDFTEVLPTRPIWRYDGVGEVMARVRVVGRDAATRFERIVNGVVRFTYVPIHGDWIGHFAADNLRSALGTMLASLVSDPAFTNALLHRDAPTPARPRRPA